MGKLFDYFSKLRNGNNIDTDIISVINNVPTDNAGDYPCYVYKGKRWNQRGSFLRKFNSWYIPYEQGMIISHKIVQGQDALSFDFSGCAFARFTDDNYDINAAHIFLYGVGDLYDCRDVWNEFVNKRCLGKPIIFKPTIELRPLETANYPNIFGNKCLGLISHSGDCYQISVSVHIYNSILVAMKFNYMEKAKPLKSGRI